ncbi:MAG: DNA recombination protein RmuC [Bacteroidota bacterium]
MLSAQLSLLLLGSFLGLLIGLLLGWLIARLRAQATTVTKAEVEAKYVEKTLYQHLQASLDVLQADQHELDEEIKLLTKNLATKDQIIVNLEGQLAQQQQNLEHLQQRLHTEFENLANRLLDEKSQKFTAQNQTQLQHLLDPLKEKIKTFEELTEKRFLQETHDRISLKKEIEQLRHLNHQLSEDANKLASALKGDNKTQGDWGELQLQRILEKAGLVKGIHFQTQASFKDDQGKLKRPDFIIHLPEGKHLIIDSKVSLVAYEQFHHAETSEEQATHLKNHLQSIRQHLKDLSSKNYQQLYDIHSPDYLLLFIPIEPAFAVAMQGDQRIFLEALDKNIVIVSTSTLLATMRTVSFIWKQEKQKKSVLEIARQSGLLYDKFCAFVEDLKAIGHRLDQSQQSYQQAMNKLVNSKKFGDTLIGRAEKIKALGAKANRQLPSELLPDQEAAEKLDLN